MRRAGWLALVGGCAEPWLPMAPERVCDDVRYAISARTFECTDDTVLAQARSDAFDEAFACAVESLNEPIDRYYHCPVTVNALSCDDVASFADDLVQWLAVSDACAVILTYADGSPLPNAEEP